MKEATDIVEQVFTQTCNIAAACLSQHDGCTTQQAAYSARKVMADLLGVVSIRFEITKDHRDAATINLIIKS